MKPIKKILIVCTGNSCRSVMAEGYLSAKLKGSGINDIIISSAGTGTVSGMKPTDEAVRVMKDNGVDISGYRSSILNKLHIDKADVILVMEPYHREKILDLAPGAKDKIRFLREFSSERNPGNYIQDPIGKPVEVYEEVFKIIKDSVEGFLKWLKE